jgi:putative Holliday junction resolvase
VDGGPGGPGGPGNPSRPGVASGAARANPGRALGLDLGERRIGVALSDSGRTLASPHEVVVRSGDRERDRARIAAIVEETGATVVVVGLPFGLDGRIGIAARGVLSEVEALGSVLEVTVETADERFTTVEVERRRSEALGEADAGRRGGRGARRRSAYGASRSRSRAIVDSAAAAVMLQAWCDARRAGPGAPDEPGASS